MNRAPQLRAPALRRRSLLAGTAAALALAACAPIVPRETPSAALRPLMPAFLLDGRLSATDGRQAASGRVEWEHAPQTDRLTLLSPLGQIVARLDSDPAGARLLSADGTRRDAPSADALLPEVLGIEVPSARLPRWVQGAPDAGAQIRERDALGRPQLVIDQGWRIDYLAYADDRSDALPARLDISRGEARIRLIIDSWTALP
ncbi:lipoprotein insertase outer membrane protein LolB [Thauera sp.]|jgi:outer membrane lipoprotein LolB|uniref:lipoprotein insertase outer membrane protein LolB n=1 Tax=Thauera sp. TaxID=1905334 RepID=UPI002A36FA95|nr:lipoprotein insertase outer membrane protein LolB [Thauera sp.]MDX9885820.1 lipoprotein insertase outer membrane protein LolB [Thauera sp.]